VIAFAATHIKGPHVDWASLAPLVALTVGALVVLLVGLVKQQTVRFKIVPALTAITLVVAIVLAATRFHHPRYVVSGALAIDDLALVLYIIFCAAGIAAVLMSLRVPAPSEAGHGEFHSLLLFSVLGMAVLVSAQNLVSLFLGFELLSIPLYVLCASEARREGSLESGLKYLIIGSVGSATLVYGLAMVYGASGSTDYAPIAQAIASGDILTDPLLLTGLGLITVGFAFKASIAPFHQWTPDVYEGAPTPITAFMATATKAAALGAFLRFFDVAAIGAQDTWGPLLAALAAITIIVGNVGALGQSSLKRMLAYSGVAQAGYMLSGVVVGTRLGIDATVFYLAVYLFMNMAAFGVIVVRERESGPAGDDLGGLAALGARRPGVAAPMTIAMLSLAGIPATVGFIGKFYLIRALVDGDYTWLAIVLVIGSMLSLGYYLRVIGVMWMGPGQQAAPVPSPRPALAGGAPSGGFAAPPIAGGSPELDSMSIEGSSPAAPAPATSSDFPVMFVAVVAAGASVFFGIFPSSLFTLVSHAGNAISGLF
jgi:NADH-quinone oxidoreductase subunit N